jgi:hypothetical protein
MEKEETDWKMEEKVKTVYLKIPSQHFPCGTDETMKNLSQ